MAKVTKARSERTHVYVGRKACGCAVAVCNDDADDPKWTAKTVGEYIKYGYAVERLTMQEYRERAYDQMRNGCPHKS